MKIVVVFDEKEFDQLGDNIATTLVNTMKKDYGCKCISRENMREWNDEVTYGFLLGQIHNVLVRKRQGE